MAEKTGVSDLRKGVTRRGNGVTMKDCAPLAILPSSDSLARRARALMVYIHSVLRDGKPKRRRSSSDFFSALIRSRSFGRLDASAAAMASWADKTG